ncbi:UbiA family prenyltransferase [Microbacterium imperiale]|uniref:Prenyltransferase n=1 Tax=Microbacterium imperiale TaxID=33884 RepID=A0A9W6M404_9MICO|nr:UbiA family prenyltransferase [Microbacterium imperiale]MBP2420989.1 4-hydroxybenzoate polyprenyltransferase [Microbacterium imperiale]MDS0199897.1 UbiA family prenyltransferase [Microbacterium imperiale]BFE41331.1 UbiA family prenyltransferase [Microbacterium imperiale]GLJ80282.1 prenyltransferase [Microbacterium imperiale]
MTTPEPRSAAITRQTSTVARLVHISRPVLWINTIGTGALGMWLTGQLIDVAAIPLLVWLTLPFNLLIYGVNDIFDQETDALNPRKGSIEGARIEPREVKLIAWAVAITNIPFLVYFVIALPLPAVALILLYAGVFVFYSAPPLRFKARPFLDSLSNAAYGLPLLILPVALEAPPVWPAVIGLLAWSVAKHAYDAVQDIDEDREAGITTTAVLLGPRGTALWSGAWWLVSTVLFALISVPVALVNLALAGTLVVWMLLRPAPATGRKLYPLSVAFPYIAGSVASGLLLAAMFLGIYP